MAFADSGMKFTLVMLPFVFLLCGCQPSETVKSSVLPPPTPVAVSVQQPTAPTVTTFTPMAPAPPPQQMSRTNADAVFMQALYRIDQQRRQLEAEINRANAMIMSEQARAPTAAVTPRDNMNTRKKSNGLTTEDLGARLIRSADNAIQGYDRLLGQLQDLRPGQATREIKSGYMQLLQTRRAFMNQARQDGEFMKRFEESSDSERQQRLNELYRRKETDNRTQDQAFMSVNQAMMAARTYDPTLQIFEIKP